MQINNWKMDFDKWVGLDCPIPCDMYSTLYENGCISDPYYGTNEENLCHLSRKDCTFYSSFRLNEKQLSSKHIEITFLGLDTICDIYVNGTLLDSVKNMHRKYTYDIKGIATLENEIRLNFKSPIEYFEKMEKIHHLYMNGDTLPGASHLRKAFYMSGWDWAPKLPNMGIFRPVEVDCYDIDKIEDFLVIQNHEGDSVSLEVSIETKHKENGLTYTCEIDGQTVTLENGKGEITIKNPKLWWPRGYGKQSLYEISFSIYKKDTLLDKITKRIGLRTLYVSREDDQYGQEFCFVINGVKIFAMGANYVPIDCMLSRVNKDRTERLIKDCVFANFNCVRVWGGAYYPEDYFFDLCDEYGLIVWQDFMVACANIWLTSDMEKEFTEEAIYNVKRIRHHASLGVLCGNNEMEEAICFWEDADGNDPLVRSDYLKLYENILPSICKEYAPFISYIPSSPTSKGGFESPQDKSVGDVHFWDVWNGNCEFDEYRRHKFRFCSEYGFESLPSIKTIDYFCPREERNLLSYTMESHQKHWHGNVKLLKYLAEEYQMPKDLETTVYASQLNQANAIKFGVEHFRRNRGYTMGSIYWQLNDPWPVASWSSVDYFGRYKALHYFARKFYQDVSLGLFNEEGSITINVANETTNEFKGYVLAGVKTTDLETVYEFRKDFVISPLSSLDVDSRPNYDFNGKNCAFFFSELYDENDKLIASNIVLGSKPKHFDFPKPSIGIYATETQGGVNLQFSSHVLVKNLELTFKGLELKLSDNYFDLTGKPYTVFVETDLTAEQILDRLSYLSVYDISLKY